MKKITKFIYPAFAALALSCFALLPGAQAVMPPPDGGYPGANTAEGTDALLNLTTGIWNTALGFEALKLDTVGRTNTATGVRALGSNTSGSYNTANGVNAMNANNDGWFNATLGAYALANNIQGDGNTAVGYTALWRNTSDYSTAVGYAALYNSTGVANTAQGAFALFDNTLGVGNVANGYFALNNTTTGNQNTAIGLGAGANITSGDANTCLGTLTCLNTTSADNVVCVGSGANGENFSNRAYIPNIGVFVQNFVAGDTEWVTVRLSDGKLGHSASSRRYKEDIKPMGDASELIYKLKPVTYRFKQVDVDPKKGPQPQNLDYGLIAEDVAEIDPKLAIRDGKGQIESLRYVAIYNMMLNEFLKEHRKVEAHEATIAELKSTIAQQQKGMEMLTAQLQEQAAQIQKVSAQLETSKPATKVVVNTP